MNTEVKTTNSKSFFLSTQFMTALFGVIILSIVMVFTLLLQMPAFSQPAGVLDWLFAASSQQLMWYITRSAGLTAYLVLWFSVAWGLAVPSKILDNLLHRTFTYDFHQFISLLAIGFTLLHVIVLMFDRYLPYSATQILIPFLSPYRPLWVGIGVIGFYLMVLVTVTFYMRRQIGMKAFRVIHIFSLFAYLGVTLHSFFSGTDTPLVSVMAMYVITFLMTIALTLYWLIVLMINHQKKKSTARGMAPITNRNPQPVMIQAQSQVRTRR